MKTILLYGSIDSYKAREFHAAVSGITDESEEVLLRINSPGGSPEYGWGMISMFKDLKNPKRILVDGQAHSMGAYFLAYANDVESLDVSEFLIHRAAYPEWIESNPENFDDAMKGNLIRVNQSLEKALRSKIDVAKFEAMKQVRIKDIFSLDSRIDVFLTAKEAKEIGLISKITKLTAEMAADITMFAKAAQSENKIYIPKAADQAPEKPLNPNPKHMTQAELKAAHPELFADIQKDAVAQERDRVGAWMAFNDVDPVAVAKGITDGASMSHTMMAELSRKSVAKAAVTTAAADSPEGITPEGAKTAEQIAKEKEAKDLADFMAESKAIASKNLGIEKA
jgi:ATP-dependent protease ClpP protease subunit